MSAPLALPPQSKKCSAVDTRRLSTDVPIVKIHLKSKFSSDYDAYTCTNTFSAIIVN